MADIKFSQLTTLSTTVSLHAVVDSEGNSRKSGPYFPVRDGLNTGQPYAVGGATIDRVQWRQTGTFTAGIGGNAFGFLYDGTVRAAAGTEVRAFNVAASVITATGTAYAIAASHYVSGLNLTVSGTGTVTLATNQYIGAAPSGAGQNLSQYVVGQSLFQSGAILSNTAGDTAINRSIEGTVVEVATGPIPSTTTTVSITRIGNLVSVTFPAMRVTGNTSAATISLTALAADYRPVTSLYVIVPLVTDNGSDQSAPGLMNVGTNGAITIYKNVALGNFTSSGLTTGYYGFNACWEVA